MAKPNDDDGDAAFEAGPATGSRSQDAAPSPRQDQTAPVARAEERRRSTGRWAIRVSLIFAFVVIAVAAGIAGYAYLLGLDRQTAFEARIAALERNSSDQTSAQLALDTRLSELASAVDALDLRILATESSLSEEAGGSKRQLDSLALRLDSAERLLREVETGTYGVAVAEISSLAQRVDGLAAELGAAPLSGLEGLPSQLSSLQTRMEALEVSVNAPADAERWESLATRMDDLERRISAMASSGEVVAVAAPDPATDTITLRLDELERGLEELQRLREADLESTRKVTERIDVSESGAEEFRAALGLANASAERLEAEVASGIEALRTRLASIEKEFERLRAAGGGADVGAALALLARAADLSSPFPDELANYERVAAAKAPLEIRRAASEGVPSRRWLKARFPEAAQRAAAELAGGAEDGDALGRVQVWLEGLVTIRSADEIAGETPLALLSQAEARVAEDDFAAAVAALAQLPDSAAAAVAEWVVDATHRIETDAAIDRLLAGLRDAPS